MKDLIWNHGLFLVLFYWIEWIHWGHLIHRLTPLARIKKQKRFPRMQPHLFHPWFLRGHFENFFPRSQAEGCRLEESSKHGLKFWHAPHVAPGTVSFSNQTFYLIFVPQVTGWGMLDAVSISDQWLSLIRPQEPSIIRLGYLIIIWNECFGVFVLSSIIGTENKLWSQP